MIKSKKLINLIASKCIEANFKIRDDVKIALELVLKKEKEILPKEALRIILKNLYLAQEERMPLCQDTGIVTVFVEIGEKRKFLEANLEEIINQGIRKGYKEGYLRKSVVKEPILKRINTNDNTPGVIHFEITKGKRIKISILPKGFGAENMSRLGFLNPTASIEIIKKFVIDTVKFAGANACPPVIVGVGIGGTMEKAAYLAKKSLLRKIFQRNPNPSIAKLENELLKEINKLGIGILGLGGKTTSLGVNIETFPTHIAGLPIAVNLSCYALRYEEIII